MYIVRRCHVEVNNAIYYSYHVYTGIHKILKHELYLMHNKNHSLHFNNSVNKSLER